ncbi:MAG: HAD-IA family hydrolase [Rhodospirillales bacterium]
MGSAPVTVLFDLDGTLIDSLPDVALAVDATLLEAGLPAIGYDSVRTMVGWGALRMLEMAFDAAGGSLPADEAPACVERYLGHYRSRPVVRTTLYPGVKDGLAALRRAGHPMGICSNKPREMIDIVLRELDIAQYFSGITGGDDVTWRKPDGRHLTETLTRMGLPFDAKAIMVGDSQTDRGGARSAGVPFVAVTWGYDHLDDEPLSGDAVIDHFDGLGGALADLRAARRESD